MEIIEKKRPGGETSKRISHVFFICDTSDSMNDDGKIAELNNCLRESVPHMKKLEEENPGVDVRINVMAFNTKASWIVQNIPIKDFVWNDLKAQSRGETNMGEAFSLLGVEMRSAAMPQRGFPPLAVVISDGQATDSYRAGLDEYLQSNWGAKSIRYAIAIGKDADQSVLQKFINHSEVKPIQANNPEQLAKAIRFVSTVALKKASEPSSETLITPEPSVVSEINDSSNDVW